MQSQLVALLLSCLHALVRTDSEWTIPIEHNFKGDASSWQQRGSVVLFASRVDGGLIGRYQSADFTFTPDDKQLLVDAVGKDALYRIRAPSRLDAPTIDPVDPDSFAMSFTEPNRMIQSDLQEVLLLHVDSSARRVVSVSSQPIVLNYDDAYVPIAGDLISDAFNTTVRIIDAQDGPAPETMAYIQKLEQERQAREQGDAPDNRSFIAKYWMYIVPVFIFLMISSAANPEGDGGR